MADKTEETDNFNLLELAPGSWLLALIQILPAKDRLSLFQVSRPLASVVVQGEVKPTLYIRSGQDQQVAPAVADQRRGVITQLLLKCKAFGVVMDLRHDGPTPFPASLCGQIISLDIRIDPAAGHANECIDWYAFHCVTELKLSCHQSSSRDVGMWCKALEAGHMQKLMKLEFTLEQGVVLADSVLERLAHALGGQLQQLTTNIGQLITHLPTFVVLESLLFHECSLTSVQAERLCEHASLHTVQIGYMVAMEGNHSHRACGWKTLKVAIAAWEMLPKLPLSGVQNFCALHGVSGWHEHILKNVLSQHAHRFTCQPGRLPGCGDMPTFILDCPCEVMLPLLARLHAPCRLQLRQDPQHADVVRAVWKVLPTCVQVVCLKAVQEATVDWAHLWQGLPEHVHTMEIEYCYVPAIDLCMLVRTAPQHISLLKLLFCDHEAHYDLWKAAGLYDCVPAHVTLITGPAHMHSQDTILME